ncbi:MAG: T9SS type A sorting domain-containing protein [Chitinispirillaceae bacterium]|nr:T9SS type A sorting domain-containing protein [Chitinispirillaceae bacterium]
MVKKHPILMVLALSCIAGTAWSQVELKGTVKDGSGKAIEGVIVGITKDKIKDTTDSKGEFNITDITTAIKTVHNLDLKKVSFNINGQKVYFSLPSQTKNVSLDIISANGQKAFATSIDNSIRSNIEIPQLKSGIYLLKLKAGSQQLVQKIITTGEQLIFSDVASSVNGSESGLRLASSANVDTIVATKSGYITKKVPVDSYKKSGIAIVLELDNGPVVCELPKLPEPSALPINEKFPDPFTFFDGTKMTKKSQWDCRRKEILAMASKYLYGPHPDKPDEVTGTVSGGTVNINCKVGSKTASFSASIKGSGDLPICLELTGGIFPKNHKTLTLGSGNENKIKTLYGISEINHLLADAWMVDRVMDVLELNPSSGHDPKKLMVSGCSGCGKAAFTVGLFSRIPLTVVVESGGGGIANMRMTHWMTYGGGKSSYNCKWNGNTDWPQTMDDLENSGACGPWYASTADWVRKKNENVNKLPFDTHLLLASFAPRYLCSVTNQHGRDEWCHLSGTAEIMSGWAAKPVFKALGIPERMGCLMYTEGSAPGHCGSPGSATSLAGEFFKRVFEGDESAKTDVCDGIKDENLQLSFDKWKDMWIDWDMETELE